jgi:hypothetical protein
MTCYERLRRKTEIDEVSYYKRLDNYFRALETKEFEKRIEEYHKKRGR